MTTNLGGATMSSDERFQEILRQITQISTHQENDREKLRSISSDIERVYAQLEHKAPRLQVNDLCSEIKSLKNWIMTLFGGMVMSLILLVLNILGKGVVAP